MRSGNRAARRVSYQRCDKGSLGVTGGSNPPPFLTSQVDGIEAVNRSKADAFASFARGDDLYQAISPRQLMALASCASRCPESAPIRRADRDGQGLRVRLHRTRRLPPPAVASQDALALHLKGTSRPCEPRVRLAAALQCQHPNESLHSPWLRSRRISSCMRRHRRHTA